MLFGEEEEEDRKSLIDKTKPDPGDKIRTL